LYANWEERTIQLKNYRDKYFCYGANSKSFPRDYHFKHFSKDISPESITKNIEKIILNIDKLKSEKTTK